MKRFSKQKLRINPRLKSGVNEKGQARRTVSKGFGGGALVICNGEAPSKRLARQLASRADLIVAADGGANVCRKLGIHPDVIIGDFDSISSATKNFFAPQGKRLKPLQGFVRFSAPRPEGRSNALCIRVKRQDNTDLEKALDYLVAKNISRATIIAATGNRLDHTLGNLSVIWNYTPSMNLSFVGDDWFAIPVGKVKKIAARVGTTVSLVPFGNCSGITLKGLQYTLTSASMNVGEIGVSNVVERSPFTVEVKKGKMLMIVLAAMIPFCIRKASISRTNRVAR